jgi:hypothetical protein
MINGDEHEEEAEEDDDDYGILVELKGKEDCKLHKS